MSDRTDFIFPFTISGTSMFTIYQISDRNSDRIHDCNHLLAWCHFVSMFAKAPCVLRKLVSINGLRRARLYQRGAQGHKKLLCLIHRGVCCLRFSQAFSAPRAASSGFLGICLPSINWDRRWFMRAFRIAILVVLLVPTAPLVAAEPV